MARFKIIPAGEGRIEFRTVVNGEATAALDLPGGDYEYILDGEFTLQEVQKYVGVELLSRDGFPYTYIDPYGDLARGDVVRVPFGASNRLWVGRVVAADVEPPRGLFIKTVAERARFE